MKRIDKTWGRIHAAPNEYMIHLRKGRIIAHGPGRTIFAWPSESWVRVPTSIQRVAFAADQITAEKVGVEVRGVAVFRVADPLLAFRVLDFDGPAPMHRIHEILCDMFVGAARRLVANMTVEACLTRRKEEIAAELIREIRPVVSGEGRPQDTTDRGWGLIVDTIEIQDVKILSEEVFQNLQAPYRASIEREARQSEVARDHEVHVHEVKAAQARLESARRTAALEHELAEQRAQQLADLDRQRVQDELALLADALDIERRRGEQEAALERLRRDVEDTVSEQRIRHDYVMHVLPALAAAMAENVGSVHITQVQGADNPLGYLASLLGQLKGLTDGGAT